MIAQVAAALVVLTGDGIDPALAAATQAAVKEQMARGGVALIDLSAERKALSAKTRSPFVDFAAPLPAFLPPELGDPWKRGSEACAKQIGPTDPQPSPYRRALNAREATSCKMSLHLAMWDLLLKAKKVTRVMEVQIGKELPSDSIGIAIYWLELDGNGRVVTRKHLSADQVTAAAVKVVDDLLGGAGEKVLPGSPDALPSLGVPELEAAAFGRPQPAKVPASCTGLPSRLEVFPPGKVTRAIEAAYRTIPANRRTGAPRRCDLVLFPGFDFHGAPLALARLACPPRYWIRAEGPVAEPPVLIANLVDHAVKDLCAPEGAQ